MKGEKDDIDDDSKLDSDDNSELEIKRQSKTQYNWDTHTKKYKADIDISSVDDKLKDENNDEKKIIEKSKKGRFVRYDESLGNGSFKRVYKGYDFDLGKEVAWNVINMADMSDEKTQKIIDEINLIKVLRHPSIINYISGWVNESKKEIVFITDLYYGSLKQYLNKIKYQRLRVIKCWCRDILKGLKYLHEQKNPIIHRDIKCDNIFIDQNDGKITIGDLGYSCVLKNDFANSFSGTPEFMSPEVFDMKYGTGADIYSFGMCLLEMVTLEKPYKECNNILSIYNNSKAGILPVALKRIKMKSVSNFILSCLKSENERPTAHQLLESEFLNEFDKEENNFPVPILDENLEFIINPPFSGASPELRSDLRVSSKFSSKNTNLDVNRNNEEDSTKNVKIKYSNKIKPAYELKINDRTGFETKKSEKFENSSTKNLNLSIEKENRTLCKKDEENLNFDLKNSDNKLTINAKKSKIKNVNTFSNLNSKTNNFFKKNITSTISKNLEIVMKNEIIENEKITLILKLKKVNWKTKKRFKFYYNLKNDSYQKVAKELETQLKLDPYETQLFEEKLGQIIENFIEKINFKSKKEEFNEDHENNIDFHRFSSEYQQLIHHAEKIMNLNLQWKIANEKYRNMMILVDSILLSEKQHKLEVNKNR